MRKIVVPTVLALGTLIPSVMGCLIGALPLSGVEPGGAFVSCGPALFGRPSPLPNPACATAYAPLPQISIGLILVGIAYAATGVFYLSRRKRTVALESPTLGP